MKVFRLLAGLLANVVRYVLAQLGDRFCTIWDNSVDCQSIIINFFDPKMCENSHIYNTQNKVTLIFTLCNPVLVNKCNSCVGCKLCHVRNASVSRSGLSLKTGIFNPSLPRDI